MIALPLHVDGLDLKTPDGARVKLIGCSDFAQLRRWLQPNGQTALVEPIIRERTDLARAAGWTGPLVARIFRHGRDSNPFAVMPWAYPMSAAAELTQCYNSYGWYVDWTGGDYQYCFPGDRPLDGPRGIHEHHNQFTAALTGLGYIWNVCNEPFQNGLDPFDAPPPPWVTAPWYSGTYNDPRDPSCVNLHTDRSEEAGAPKWVGKAHESGPYMWAQHKPVFYDEPMGAAEDAEDNRRSNVPAYFGILGTVITMVNAVYFHSTPGISSDGFTPIVKTCWSAFCRGAAAGVTV